MPQTLGGVPVQIDYTSRDYEAYRTDLLTLAAAASPDKWTDFFPSDFGVVLIELFAYVGDNLSYYNDRVANEMFLRTAQLRSSIVKHAEKFGYTLRPAVSAQVTLRIRSVNVTPQTLYKGSQFSTKGSGTEARLVFETAEDLVLPVAGDYEVIAVHGESITDVVKHSNGSRSFSITLDRTPLAFDPDLTSSLVIEVDENGNDVYQIWSEVDDFLDSGPTDSHYTVDIDENDVVTVTFGDGASGKLIPNGGRIRSKYRIGGGVVGNSVGYGKITEVVSAGITFLDTTSPVTNLAPPSGGKDRESEDEARINIPRSIKTLDRAVTADDYKYLTEQLTGVRAAKAVVGSTSWQTHVYVAMEGSNPAPTGAWDPVSGVGSGQMGTIGEYLQDRAILPIDVYIFGPTMVSTNVVVSVQALPNYFNDEVQQQVEEALGSLLDPSNRGFQDALYLSDAYAALDGLEGVKRLNITQLQRTPFIEEVAVGVADTEFTSIVTSVDVATETWTILFTSPTAFQVTGSVSGPQVNTGTVGVVYTSDDGTLSFDTTAGMFPNTAGNTYQIRTGALVGDVELEAFEIIQAGTVTVTVYGGVP